MFKRTDWLHLHGADGGSSSSDEDSSSEESQGAQGGTCRGMHVPTNVKLELQGPVPAPQPLQRAGSESETEDSGSEQSSEQRGASGSGASSARAGRGRVQCGVWAACVALRGSYSSVCRRASAAGYRTCPAGRRQRVRVGVWGRARRRAPPEPGALWPARQRLLRGGGQRGGGRQQRQRQRAR